MWLVRTGAAPCVPDYVRLYTRVAAELQLVGPHISNIFNTSMVNIFDNLDVTC